MKCCSFFLQKNAKGQVLFDKICDKIELAEKDYFGLRYIDEKDGQVNGNISQNTLTLTCYTTGYNHARSLPLSGHVFFFWF